MDDIDNKKPAVAQPRMFDAETTAKIQPQGTAGSTIETNNFFSANKWFVVASILGLIILAVALWFVFKKPPASQPKEAKVDMVIDVPTEVTAGGEMVYKITVQNKDSNNLKKLELELIYPEGVTYVSSQPNAASLSGSTFPVPDLPSGYPPVTLFIKVKVQGSIGDSRTLRAKLRYQMGDLALQYTKDASAETRIISSDVTLEITGPGQTNNAQLVIYELKYANNSDRSIDNARLQLTYPTGFGFASSEPQPTLGKNVWSLGRLNPGQNGSIKLQGNFLSAVPGESKTIQAEFQVLDSRGSFYTQARAEFITSITTLPLIVTQALDNAEDDGVINPGDTLSFTVSYQNNAAVAARGVNVVVTLEGKALDLATLRAEGGTINNNSITWNAASDSNLEILNPNDRGELRYSVRVKNPPVRDSSKNLEVQARIKVKSNEYDTFLPGNDVKLKIQTQTVASAGVEFAGGDLPPRVGKFTTYRITWSVRNTTNDLNGAQIVGYTPLGAGSFDPKSVVSKDGGTIDYDSSTGKLTWKIGAVPANTGTLNPVKSISFTLRANPARAQVGDVITLVKDVVYTAKDSFTQRSIEQNIQTQTSDVIVNGQSGQGIVVE